MQKLFKALGLWLLLLLAQQGAVEHDLGHYSAPRLVGINAGPSTAADGPCALCPAFAQAATPAFSHSFRIPLPATFALAIVAQRLVSAIHVFVPHPRSRGPPALS